MSDPVKADLREDGLVIWRFTADAGTVDVEAASKLEAAAKYQMWLNPPLRVREIDKLDPAKATVADVINAIKASS